MRNFCLPLLAILSLMPSAHAKECELSLTLDFYVNPPTIYLDLKDRIKARDDDENVIALMGGNPDKKSCESLMQDLTKKEFRLSNDERFEQYRVVPRILGMTCRSPEDSSDFDRVSFEGMSDLDDRPTAITVGNGDHLNFIRAEGTEIKINKPKVGEFTHYFVSEGKFIVKLKRDVSEEGEDIFSGEVKLQDNIIHKVNCL